MQTGEVMAETAMLCPAADISQGQIRPATLPDGTQLALYNVRGRIYATANLCTHGQASLSEEGTLEGNIVECGWHFGRFDVTTGEPCGQPCTVALRIFPVKIIEGMVHVEY